MNRKRLLGVCAVIALNTIIMCGCGKTYFPKVQENHEVIEFGGAQNEDADKDNDVLFSYNGRDYVQYSMMNKPLKEKEVKEILGTVKVNGIEMPEEFILSLKDCESNDYLVWFDDNGSLMGKYPNICRAVDTRGEKIDTPDFVPEIKADDPLYEYWTGKESTYTEDEE